MINAFMNSAVPLAATLVAVVLVAPFASHATWKPRERTDGGQTGRADYLRRADLLSGRLVPGPVAAGRASAAPARQTVTAEPVAQLQTASAAAPGQAGYVHYFLIRKPDGTAEMQVGIELADQMIAWAFPDLGVIISPFIETGTLTAKDERYEVRHLFGLRPFPGDEPMTRLILNLPARIAPYVDGGVEHCDIDPAPRGRFCVSCLGFVLRVLFPGPFPLQAALPADFSATRSSGQFSTEDLLLYLAGLQRVASREARVERINALAMPTSLREELMRLVTVEIPAVVPAPAAPSKRRAPVRGTRIFSPRS